MMEKNQLKAHGLRYGRSLQTVIKVVTMYSIEHPSVTRPLQTSYDLLNAVVRQTRYLTIGFVDQRVMINNILTADESIKPLEAEFMKRGVGAVTFDAGITLAAYKNAVAALAASPKTIEENGGLMVFLEGRPLEFVRIFPANKTEDRDTVLEMSSEEYLISKAFSDLNLGMPPDMEALLQQIQPVASPGSGGSGAAEPDGKTAGGQSSGEPGAGGLGAGPGGPGFGGSGFGGTGSSGTGPKSAGSGGSGPAPGTGTLGDIQRAVEQRLEASLKNPDEDPQKAYTELTRIIREMRPDPAAAGAEGAKSDRQEMSAEVFENSALRWAVQRLSSTPVGEDAVMVEEQVFRVLLRSLQTTQAASRMMARLAELAGEFAIPRQTYNRIHEELQWAGMPSRQKLRDLLGITHFSRDEFRRVLDLIKELVRQNKPEDAAALGMQYLSIFENYNDIRIEEVGRLPELMNALAGVQGEFWPSAAHLLTKALVSPRLNQVIHFQVVNALAVLSQTAGRFEDFDRVCQVGNALEQCAGSGPAHAKCCAAALSSLLAPSVVDRIGEIFLRKKEDSGWIRTAAALLRWSGPMAVERLFATLEAEPVAANRLALMRLLARAGAAGLDAARKRILHPEWYVVRNACKILAELKDPELFQRLTPALQHKDERVQQAALQALKDSRLAGVAGPLAEALPYLSRALQEETMNELAYLRDVNCLPGLLDFLTSPAPPVNGSLARIMQIIASIPNSAAADALAGLAVNLSITESVRNAAMQALGRISTDHAQRRLRALQYDSPAESATGGNTTKVSA